MGMMDEAKYGFNTDVKLGKITASIYIDSHNKRLKMQDYEGRVDQLQNHLIPLCRQHDLGKIICTVSEKNLKEFLENKYVAEGTIEGFFKGEAGWCVSYFVDEKRSRNENTENENLIVNKAKEFKNQFNSKSDVFDIRTAAEDDAESIADLFQKVFKTYPTPMNSPEYIMKTMTTHVLFKMALVEGSLASVASADMNNKLQHAEITDCATLEEYRGRGLLSELIHELEQELINRKFITLFSLCRALSEGMNIVLSKHGYDYTGRLVNNCNIMGRFEDMNIWVKKL